MTWFFVAGDPATGHVGVAHASRFFAIGGIRAVATLTSSIRATDREERFLYVADTMKTRQNLCALIDRGQIDRKIAAPEAERVAAGQPSASFATSLKT